MNPLVCICFFIRDIICTKMYEKSPAAFPPPTICTIALLHPVSLYATYCLKSQGVGILAPCLPSSLVDLNLSDNPGMGEKGGSAMGRFLLDFVRSANLRRLDMSSCGLGDAGLRNLAEGVSAAPGLEWLGVAGNLRGITEGEGNGAGRMALGTRSFAGC